MTDHTVSLDVSQIGDSKPQMAEMGYRVMVPTISVHDFIITFQDISLSDFLKIGTFGGNWSNVWQKISG